ncbi:uncharacterized protein l(3)87Df isoform X2 [Cherax quadricarinatus]|uniref:uncharacterized protein l(3)87Df isoform X2 n=1 Tax=Cherax quadricarinatus TaxID=27406 RepID=UPI00387E7A8A
MAEESEKEVMFMNREISKMPCFRETFLYSISSGLAVGLIHFMLTSKVQRSSHLAFGTYGCVTLAYWVQRQNRKGCPSVQEILKKKNYFFLQN